MDEYQLWVLKKDKWKLVGFFREISDAQDEYLGILKRNPEYVRDEDRPLMVHDDGKHRIVCVETFRRNR